MKMMRSFFVTVFFLACYMSLVLSFERALVKKAIVVFNVGSNLIHGSLELTQRSPKSFVSISGVIYGLNPNMKQGFHVHESGDVRDGCNSTLSHFNPHQVRYSLILRCICTYLTW